MVLIVRPDSEDYPLCVFLATLIAAYTNAHCHCDLAGMDDEKRLAEIDQLKKWFEELMH